ncbi:MAG TPA: hypothetical protein DEA52_02605 [Clostridiaceae bacterium]|nr:hypothetical protein [Clostridiaceae bacterium]
MSLKDVQDRIKVKKRKRRKRILTVLFLLILVAGGVFLTHAPYFSVRQLQITGNEKIELRQVESQGAFLLDQNIFLLKQGSLKEQLSNHPYFLDVEVKRILPDGVHLYIKERVAEVNYYNQGVVSLLTGEGILLEIGADPILGPMLIEELSLPALGTPIYEEASTKKKALMEFTDLMKRNTSSIQFQEIDLRDETNIRTYYKNLEIRLGYGDSMKQKLNAAINIILDGQLEEVHGYVDVSYLAHPVVFDEALQVEEEEVNPEEETEDGASPPESQGEDG